MPLLIMKEQLYLVLKVRKHLHLIIHTFIQYVYRYASSYCMVVAAPLTGTATSDWSSEL